MPIQPVGHRTQRMRQAETAQMPKCKCGNVAPEGKLMCAQCRDQLGRPRKTDALRDAAENVVIAYAMGGDLDGVIEVLRAALED